MVITGKREPNGQKPAAGRENGSISKWRLQALAKGLLPGEKNLGKCCRTTLGQVEVWASASRQSAAYRGLCTCQSVWQCPVCSARISARRAQELTEAIATHREAGGSVLLLTFTAAHDRFDALGDLLDRHKAAHARFWRLGQVRRVLAALGLLGRVTATETTYGHGSGWHPHRHALLFVDAEAAEGLAPANAERPELVQRLDLAWRQCCTVAGLTAAAGIGLDVRGGESAGAYVAKLGLELALATCKRGRGGRFGPWQLLAESADASAWAGSRFVEYAKATKGSRHLVWSAGLKTALGVEEITDAEIMDAPAEHDEERMVGLTRSLWRAVCRSEQRGQLLQLLGLGDIGAVEDLAWRLGIDPAAGFRWT